MKHIPGNTQQQTRQSKSGDTQGKVKRPIRPILQMHKDMEDVLIHEWKSAAHIERELGIHRSNIIACCKGKRKTAGGFKWCYANYYNSLL